MVKKIDCSDAPCFFFSLPLELRLYVYELTLVSRSSIDVRNLCPDFKTQVPRQTLSINSALLRAASIVYFEAFPVLYKRNRFVYSIHNGIYDALHHYEAEHGLDVSYREGVPIQVRKVYPPMVEHPCRTLLVTLDFNFEAVPERASPRTGYAIHDPPFFVDISWLTSNFPNLRTVRFQSPLQPLSRWIPVSQCSSKSILRGFEGLQQRFNQACIRQSVQCLRADNRTSNLKIELCPEQCITITLPLPL